MPGADRLRALARWGAFFAVHGYDPAVPPGPPWRPMRELADDPAAFADRVEQVRSGLATAAGIPRAAVESRVAVSVAQLGLVARLLSPVLALALDGGPVEPLPLSGPYWQPALGGPFPLALPYPSTGAPASTDPARTAAAVHASVLDAAVRDLVEVAGRWPLSARIRWGNVASALGGAATVLAAARPDRRADTVALLAELLRTPLLRGTATLDAGGRLRRTSCCLIYRTAGRAEPGNLCGDCVLA